MSDSIFRRTGIFAGRHVRKNRRGFTLQKKKRNKEWTKSISLFKKITKERTSIYYIRRREKKLSTKTAGLLFCAKIENSAAKWKNEKHYFLLS